MKIDLKGTGVHVVKRKLADGIVRVHYYGWRGGPPITAPPNTVGFVAELAEYQRQRNKPKEANRALFHSVLNQVKEASEMQVPVISARTRSDYLLKIKAIEEKFGSMPLSAFTVQNGRRTRGIFKSWKDKLALKSARQADYHWTVLARVCSIAVDRGLIDVNPCLSGGRLYVANRQEVIWTMEMEQEFYSLSPVHLHLPVLLAAWTGQRQGDLLRTRLSKDSSLRFPRYDGESIYLRQGKTGAFVAVPAIGPLKVALDAEWARADREDEGARTRRAGHVLITSRGEPWASGFASLFSKAKNKLGFKGHHFHDLRGTAVTRLALAGCSTFEIASITGHGERQVQAILEAHYLGGKAELARQAMAKL